MAQTLAESFLADLDELSDDELMQDEEQERPDAMEEDQEDNGDDLDNIEALNNDSLTAIASLSSSNLYKDVMARVRAALETDKKAGQAGQNGNTEEHRKNLEDDPTYKLLVQCNRLAVDIDNEIAAVHTYIKDKYRPKFPELEQLVHHPVDYARLVQRISNEMDLTLVDMDDLLPAATVMVVTVTGTTTTGKPLSEEQLGKVLEGCEMVLTLDNDKRTILEFVESKMSSIAPNLSLIVGSEIAARLMGVAGGLHPLSSMPACNIQVLGQKKKNLAGFSTATAQPHQGFIFTCPIMQNTPPALKSKAARLIAGKCALMARVDAYGQDPQGRQGQEMRSEIMAKIEKWQEPPPAKTIKPLPKPDEFEGRKKRGGKRARRMKERLGLTDMRKTANRMSFNVAEEEYIDGDEVVGLGMLGKEGSGRLRIAAKQAKLKVSAKTAKRAKAGTASYGGSAVSGIQTAGVTTSLAFTPVQGFELVDPTKLAGQQQTGLEQRSGTESYFSSLSGFRSIKKLG